MIVVIVGDAVNLYLSLCILKRCIFIKFLSVHFINYILDISFILPIINLLCHLMNNQMLCGIYLPLVVYIFPMIVQEFHWKLIKIDQKLSVVVARLRVQYEQ